MGSTVTRNLKGKDYIYYVYYEDGARHDIYCGPSGNPNTEKKVYEVEMDDLKKQQVILKERIAILSKKLRMVEA